MSAKLSQEKSQRRSPKKPAKEIIGHLDNARAQPTQVPVTPIKEQSISSNSSL